MAFVQSNKLARSAQSYFSTQLLFGFVVDNTLACVAGGFVTTSNCWARRRGAKKTAFPKTKLFQLPIRKRFQLSSF